MNLRPTKNKICEQDVFSRQVSKNFQYAVKTPNTGFKPIAEDNVVRHIYTLGQLRDEICRWGG